MKKGFDKLVFYFLLIEPLLNILIGLQLRYYSDYLSIGLIIRGIWFLLVLFYLFKNNKRIYVYSYVIFLLIYFLYDIFILKNGLVSELSNLFQIFYLPYLILFFINYDNKNINNKLMLIISFIIINSLVIPYILGIGYDISEYYVNKSGYIGFYNGGNEISAVMLCLLPLCLDYLKNKKLLGIIYLLEYLFCVFIVGTKVLLIGTVLVFVYLIFNYLIKYKKNIMKYIIGLLIGFIFLIVIMPFTSLYDNFKVSIDYYNVDSIDDLLEDNNIDNIIFSKRLDNASKINKEYKDSSLMNKVFGIGKNKLLDINVIEIDVFDIFYSIGIFGFIYYLLLLYFILRDSRIYGIYKFMFILLLVVSCFSGHILIKPQVAIYLGLLFLLVKNDKDYKKRRVLLVSNMYPNKKNKHYGSFVLNVNNLMKDNNIIVDKVVMYKHGNKIIKLLSYMKFHTLVIIKGIFNSYDYIYIHFVSHSSLGSVIVNKIKPNIKLIMNCHGNDIVPDYDFEEKNIRRSRKYLKHAYKVVVPSNYFKNIVINEYNVNNDDVFVYPSGGVNTKLFDKIPQDVARDNCNFDKNCYLIGYISRIEKDKGYDIFVEAINDLVNVKKVKNVKFLMVGNGLEEDILNKLIKKYKVEEYIIRKDLVTQKELVNIYNSLDIFIFPTYRKSESLGLVGLEAMSCKIPIIAANNYGPTDYVEDNVNGYLFESGNYKDLVDKILMIKNNKINSKLLDNARKTALLYDVEKTKNKILEIFN